MPVARIISIAESPLLLVASDFDGTISPLAAAPEEARVDPICLDALIRLAALPRTAVAVISGRSLAQLRERLGAIPRLMLFGSHGEEDAALPNPQRREEAAGRLGRLAGMLEEKVADWPGCRLERKPLGVAVHYRQADPSLEAEVVRTVTEIGSAEFGIVSKRGIKVIELCIEGRNKGEALRLAAYRAGASHTVFFGDDLTDEDAFAALRERDLAIKVGDGSSIAKARVSQVRQVGELLQALADSRAKFLRSRVAAPIQKHSILSDQRTIAMVTPNARVTWMCLPRLDSPAMFAELLGGPGAGYFAVEPEPGGAATEQAYLGDSMILRTVWPDVTVVDYLDCAGGRAYQRAGRTDLIRVVSGRGRVKVTFAPRLDFGRTATRLKAHVDGLELNAGPDPCALYAPGLTWRLIEDGVHERAESTVDLDECGGSLTLELRYGTANLKPSMATEGQRREQTARHWSGWAASLRAPVEFRKALVRSALIIKALSNGPSGAIAAAATTSLPEQAGGTRNWDYRFCWPRDAAMAATSLLHLGNTGHAMKLADWVIGVVDRLESPERLRPIYTVSGDDLGPEAEIGGLSGYADSRPVRVNNAAAQQVQLDVFGPISDMVATMTEYGVPVSPDAWRLVRAMVRAVEARWMEPDHGIWEIRGPRRHHVHSKVMCWHAVHRALVVHEAVLGTTNAEWRELADRIAAEVLERGWNARAGTFTAAYESADLDAASLAVGLTGLLSSDDPRWAATVKAVQLGLQSGTAVYRYRADDGLPGTEGGFVICACWMVEALTILGKIDEANDLLNGVLQQTGPTGLIAEQWDPVFAEALGNFPQAYSHLGVINAAMRLAAAIEKAKGSAATPRGRDGSAV